MKTVTPEAQLRRVFESVLDDGTPWHHPSLRIRHVHAVKGRCVQVTLGDYYQSTNPPSWGELAEDLLGNGRPCEEFRLVGWELYARVKTDEQCAADAAAFDFDEAHGAFRTWPEYLDFAVPDDRKVRKPQQKKRGPLATAIADHIEASGETTFWRTRLLADVQEALEKDGREVRADNLVRTLNTQIIGTLLEFVPDTKETQLRLKGEDDDSE